METVVGSASLLVEFREAIADLLRGAVKDAPEKGSFYPGSSTTLQNGQKQLDLAALKSGIATLVYLDSRGRVSHEFPEGDMSPAEKARHLNQDSDALSAPAMPLDPDVLSVRGISKLTSDRGLNRTPAHNVGIERE